MKEEKPDRRDGLNKSHNFISIGGMWTGRMCGRLVK